MVDILNNLHQYVPSSSTTFEDDIPGHDSETIKLYCFHKILCFGDQLTVEQIRGVKAVRSNSEDGLYQLQGFVPAISDWHAKVSFLGVSSLSIKISIILNLQVIYNRLYSNDSKGDGGTLSQLRYLINRTNVPCKPKENVHAAEEFFEAVVTGHIIAAALHFFNMHTIYDSPSSHYFDSLKNENTSEAQQKLFHSAIVDMINSYINFTPFDEVSQDQDLDYVSAYAKEVFSLGILLLEFNDSVHEGDGERLANVWKFLLLIFRAKRKTKYALEAFLLLAQANIVLPPRLREQLLYSHFVNTKGVPGGNIPIDLHVEHVNSVVKSAIYNQVSNLSPTAITRTSRCTGILCNVSEQFDKVTGIRKGRDTHSAAKLEADIHRIAKELHKTSKVFNYNPKRRHARINAVSGSIMNVVKADKVKFTDWMKQHFKNLL